MTAKYFAILTNQGAARLANAAALGTKLNLTQMAVGDANGTLPTPDPAQTKLINQKRIAPLNMLTIDPNNTSQIIAEQIIPENEGGFWIREIGLYDDDGILIAVANCPETYKPQLQEGSGRTQTIRMILIVSSTSAITLKIDPSVVLATRQYVDDQIIQVKTYVGQQLASHVASDNPHKQYLIIEEYLSEIAELGEIAISAALKNLGVEVITGSGYIAAKVGRLIIIAGSTPTNTTPDGNLNVIFPFSLPKTVHYFHGVQTKSSYAADTEPFIMSAYPSANGPVTALGFAVRNTKTGLSLTSTSISAKYLVIGE